MTVENPTDRAASVIDLLLKDLPVEDRITVVMLIRDLETEVRRLEAKLAAIRNAIGDQL